MESCELPKLYYIDQTQNSINIRMTDHLQNGSIKDHMIHRKILTKPEIVKNACCIKKFDNVQKQKIHDSLIILK